MFFEIIKVVSYGGDYNRALVPSHPNASKHNYVLEHRVIMENHLGRLLTKDEIVHHINEDKRDNRIKNLEVMDASTHRKIHAKGITMISLICSRCGCKFKREKRNVDSKLKNGQKDFYCNRSCMAKSFGRGRPKAM